MMSSLSGELQKEPADRIREELNKVMKAAKPGNFFRNMAKADCLDGWFPELVPQVGPLSDELDKCAKSLDSLSMYCIMAHFMGSDEEVKSFCGRVVLGSGIERGMQAWRTIAASPLQSPQDYMRIYEAGRRGILTYEHLFNLLATIGKESLISTIQRVISAVNSLDLASVQVKSEIPAMKLRAVAAQL
jgi:Probable RNA and SrmB- binding site of polymerase A